MPHETIRGDGGRPGHPPASVPGIERWLPVVAERTIFRFEAVRHAPASLHNLRNVFSTGVWVCGGDMMAKLFKCACLTRTAEYAYVSGAVVIQFVVEP